MKGMRITRDHVLLPWVFPDVRSAAEWVKRMLKTTKELNARSAEYQIIFEESSR